MPSRKAPGGLREATDCRARPIGTAPTGGRIGFSEVGAAVAAVRDPVVRHSAGGRNAMEVRFVILAPARRKGSIPVRLPLLVGRADEAKFRIPQDCVSRRHCEFVLEDDAVVVRDLGSTNGTFLDGERLPAREPMRVRPGAEIRIGEVAFRVDYAPSASAPAPAAPAPADADTVPLGDTVAPSEPTDLPTLEPAGDEPEPPQPTLADTEPVATSSFPIAADTAPAPAAGSFDFLPGDAAPPPAADDDNLNDFFKSLS